ncbi:MAG: hypothetical protein M3Y41_05680 [Pseudomonadota bacterium]|nr:hypothetical protein [Pseudomonadota bacterium]
MRIATIAAACLSLAPLAPAFGRPPPGTDLGSPLHKWFEAQVTKRGGSCCSEADGHLLPVEGTDWGIHNGRYWVSVQGRHFDVPDKALIRPHGGNPTAGAVVWYILGWVNDQPLPSILCFLPGWSA